MTVLALGDQRLSHWGIAGLALLWNLFGMFRFISTEFADQAQLVAMGMTPEQATLYAGLPAWMGLAFAVGVFGGALGCVLLLAKQRSAVPVFGVSLAGYLILYAGDLALGIFAAFGMAQVMILTFVLAVASGLLWYAARLSGRGMLA
jgi:hypothetical protein